MYIIDLITPPQSPPRLSVNEAKVARVTKPLKRVVGRTKVGFSDEEKKELGYHQKHPVLLKVHKRRFPSTAAKQEWIKQYGPYFRQMVKLEQDQSHNATS